MSLLERLWDSFEDRNLVLQGMLGLIAVSDAAANACAAQASQGGGGDARSLAEAELHPIVLLALGVVSFRDNLKGELDAALPLPGARPEAASLPPADETSSELSSAQLFGLLR